MDDNRPQGGERPNDRRAEVVPAPDQVDSTAGGADSAPYETTPSGEKEEAAQRPQQAPRT
jgi:hypothetical protein